VSACCAVFCRRHSHQGSVASKSLATGQASGFFQGHMHQWKEEPWNAFDCGFLIATVAVAVAIVVVAPATIQHNQIPHKIVSRSFASEASALECQQGPLETKLPIFRHGRNFHCCVTPPLSESLAPAVRWPIVMLGDKRGWMSSSQSSC
jgi:hypothetical protein